MSGSLFADLSGARGSAEAFPTIASGGGRSPTFITDPNQDWMGTDETGGWAQSKGPEMGVGYTGEKGLPSEPGIGDEPFLFEDPTRPRSGPSVTVDAGVNTRRPTGSWSRPSYEMAGFGGNMTIGQFLSTPMAFMRFGGNRYQQPVTPVVSTSGQGVQPNTSRGTWERFNPTSEQWEAVGQLGESIETVNERLANEVSGSSGENIQGQSSQNLSSQAGPSANPASQYGNLNSPTGQPVYRDSAGNWRPVAGSGVDVRWDPNNPHTSNFSASLTTKNYMLGGGDPGAPNNMAPFASEGRFLLKEEGVRQYGKTGSFDSARQFRMSQKKDAPTLYANPASQKAYNAWLAQQPEYKAWMAARGAKGG